MKISVLVPKARIGSDKQDILADHEWGEVDRAYLFSEHVRDDDTWAKVCRVLRRMVEKACELEGS